MKLPQKIKYILISIVFAHRIFAAQDFDTIKAKAEAGDIQAQYTLGENTVKIKLSSKRMQDMEKEPYGPIYSGSIEAIAAETQLASKRTMLTAWLEALVHAGHSVEFKKAA